LAIPSSSALRLASAGALSTSTAESAPREIASIASAPVPQ
jgi:hypothetical protein